MFHEPVQFLYSVDKCPLCSHDIQFENKECECVSKELYGTSERRRFARNFFGASLRAFGDRIFGKLYMESVVCAVLQTKFSEYRRQINDTNTTVEERNAGCSEEECC